MSINNWLLSGKQPRLEAHKREFYGKFWCQFLGVLKENAKHFQTSRGNQDNSKQANSEQSNDRSCK